jgi:citrate lyase subunit beta/citryl-CoA lyase
LSLKGMLMRSFHFVPGNRPEWFTKAHDAGADAIIFDLEDAVAESEKAEAVQALTSFLGQHHRQASTFVRLNGGDSSLKNEENALLEANPALGVVLPKVEGARQMEELLEQYPLAATRKLIVLIETGKGVENCAGILDRFQPFAVGLGLEDLLSASIFPRKDLVDFVRYVRCRVALAGLAHGCLTIDTVSLDTTGGHDFAVDCEEARCCGMLSKFTIHPAQIPATNKRFSPDANVVAQARKLIEMCGGRTSVGYGVLDGKIVSPPALAKAKLISAFSENNASK